MEIRNLLWFSRRGQKHPKGGAIGMQNTLSDKQKIHPSPKFCKSDPPPQRFRAAEGTPLQFWELEQYTPPQKKEKKMVRSPPTTPKQFITLFLTLSGIWSVCVDILQYQLL